MKEPLAVHLTQHEQPNCVFTVPQTTQNYDPAQLTQQCVYRNNPALLRVYDALNRLKVTVKAYIYYKIFLFQIYAVLLNFSVS